MRPKVLYTYCAKEVEKDKKRKRRMQNSRKVRGSRKKDDQKKYKNKKIELKIDDTDYFMKNIKCPIKAE